MFFITISLYRENKSGDGTQPCMTPLLSACHPDSSPFTLTHALCTHIYIFLSSLPFSIYSELLSGTHVYYQTPFLSLSQLFSLCSLHKYCVTCALSFNKATLHILPHIHLRITFNMILVIWFMILIVLCLLYTRALTFGTAVNTDVHISSIVWSVW